MYNDDLTTKTKCTECGIGSIITYSDWKGPDDLILIRKNEHLCPVCAKKRNIDLFTLSSQQPATPPSAGGEKK